MKLTYLNAGPNIPQSLFQWAKRLIDELNGALGNTSIPVGGAFLTIGAVPADYLEANGATFSADAYPLLASILGGTTLPTWTAPSGGKYVVRAR